MTHGKQKGGGIASADEWRQAARAERAERAEALRLPSGATVMAARPGPLEWIISGRIPQRLLAVALGEDTEGGEVVPQEITREEILELARFANELVSASVIEPAIGGAAGEIPLDDIPLEDRAFLFEWACRSLGGGPRPDKAAGKEDLSIPAAGIEGFRPE